MTMTRIRRALRPLCAAIALASLPLSLGATAVTAIDAFVIVRGPAVPGQTSSYAGQPLFYRDAFGDGAVPPAAGSFFNGAAASYNVLGSYPASAESAGRLALDSSLGGPFINANGMGRTLQRSVLPTDANPTSPAGLKQALHTFAVFGLFDLTIPPEIGDGYGILLTDGGPSLPGSVSIDLFVRREENGAVMIRFQEQDFMNGGVDTLERDLLVAPQGADQIELRLQRADLNSNAVTAAYRFWSGGAALGDFGPMQASVDIFGNGRGWALGGFFAVEAIPEPGTLSLLGLAAAAGLVGVRRRRMQ